MTHLTTIPIQPRLENELVQLIPLRPDDFEELYVLASDPLVWEQHPNRDRWRREVFETFFKGAMESKGAFKVVEKISGATIGSTRFYDADSVKKSILIGYTFYGKEYWGKGFNSSAKQLMLKYIFQYVDTVYFHIGAGNLRSQIAIGRIGAVKIAEGHIAYYGEVEKLNFIYAIHKKYWIR